MAKHEVSVAITAVKSGMEKVFAGASEDVKAFASTVKKAGSTVETEANRINSKLGSMGTPLTLAMTATAGAIGLLGLSAVKAAGQMEQTKKGFETLLGGAKAGNEMLRELADFASTTPFEMPGVVDGAKRLLAMGFEGKQVIPVLTAIGDAASALGLGTEGINRLTLAIGQMLAKGKVSGEEMRQLAEAGIPAWDMLAKKIGVSIPEAMKLSEKGAIDSAVGVQAILSGMNAKFGGLMKEQSNTVLGIWSNTQDELGRLSVVTGDAIVEAFDLKNKMKGALDYLTEFRQKVEKSGVKDALIDQVPAEAMAVSSAAIASTLYLTLIPALNAAKLAALSFWKALGPIGIGIAAVSAIGAYTYSDYQQNPEEKQRQVFANEGLDYDEYIKPQSTEQTKPRQSIDIKDLEKFTAENKPKADIDNLGLVKSGIGEMDSSAKSGANKAKQEAEKLKREIDRINDALASAKDKAIDAQNAFAKMKVDNVFSDLEGGAKVIGDIWKPAIDEVLKMQAELSKLNKMQEDASTLVIRAKEAGNADQIAKAEEQAARIAQLKIDYDTYYKDRSLQLEKEKTAEESALHTQVAKTKADIDKAYREGDMEAYLLALEEKKIAEMTDLQEKQALMQAYFDWEMESRVTMQEFTLQAMETFKQGMGQAFANAIVNGDNLAKSFANVGKQIVAMFIKWKVQQAIASVYSDALRKKQLAQTVADGKAKAIALKPAAVYQSTISYGLAATMGAAALGAAMLMPFPMLAKGGLATGPTMAMIGEGRYNEAVVPLGGPIFDKFFAPLLNGTDKTIYANQNIYGDINNGSDEESLFDGLNNMLFAAM